MNATARHRKAVAAWLASLTEDDRKKVQGAAREALAGTKRKRDRYDAPAQRTKEEPLDLTDADGNDQPPDEAA